ncbi:Arc family DNA-binding protein [Mesorhizobium sp. KR1-2]|uniref:Arc family DNA-binding protein n=1 Tax=Mesorhizobium sp. KR1-2 TaxID=3156609 RepID=UPI0032B3448E
MIEIAPDMKLRISVELRKKIEEAAKQNGRTMNGEINVRLEASFAAEDPIEAKVEAHDRELARLHKKVQALEVRLNGGMPSLEIDDDDAG